jgi:hypothetical protein
MKRGLLIYDPNDADGFGEAPGYFTVLVVDTQHQREWLPLLITPAELKRIRSRAQKNPEDTPRPSWLDRLLRLLGL